MARRRRARSARTWRPNQRLVLEQPPPGVDEQTRQQRDCIRVLNAAGAKSASGSTRRLVECVRTGAGGALPPGTTAQDVPRRAIPAGRIAAAAAAHRVRRRPEVSAVADVRACRRRRRERRAWPRSCAREDVFGPDLGAVPARRGDGSRGGALSGDGGARRWQRSPPPRCGRSTPAKPRGSGAAPSAVRPTSPAVTPRRRGRSSPGRWRRASGRSPRHAPDVDLAAALPGTLRRASLGVARRLPRRAGGVRQCARRSTAPIASAPPAIASRTASPRSTAAIGRSTQQSIARQWDEVLLDAIRRDTPRPTVHARNLFHLSGAMWDAWRAYGGGGSAWLTDESHASADPAADRAIAISFAAYRLLAHASSAARALRRRRPRSASQDVRPRLRRRLHVHRRATHRRRSATASPPR